MAPVEVMAALVALLPAEAIPARAGREDLAVSRPPRPHICRVICPEFPLAEVAVPVAEVAVAAVEATRELGLRFQGLAVPEEGEATVEPGAAL